MSDVSSVPPWTPMPSSSAGDAPPWSGGSAGVGEERHQPVVQAQLAVGDVDQGAVAAVAVEEHEPPGRGHRHAAAEVVEHGEQRRRRQPHRARRPGVLVGLGVGERRQQPGVDLVADPLDGRRRRPARRSAGRCCSGRCGPCCSMAPSGWTTMLRGAEAAGDVGGPEVGEPAVGGHAAHATGRPQMGGDERGRGDRRRAARRDRPRRDRRRRRPQRARHRRLPRPGRAAHAAARGPVDRRRHGRQRAVRRGDGQHLQLRPHRRSARRRSIDELDLAGHGLRYIDMEPAQVGTAWSGGPAWRHWHDVGRTIDELAATHPGEVDGYRRYLRAARPAVELILAAATEPPSVGRLTRLALRRRLAGVPTVLRWSRRSAADVMRAVLHPRRPASAPALVTGPMVWGVSPETAGHRARRADVRDAPRRPRRPAGRRQRGADRGPAPRRSSTTAATLRTGSDGRRGAVRRRAGARRDAGRRHRDHRLRRRVGVRSAADVRALAARTRRPAAAAMIDRWRRRRGAGRATSRRSTPSSTASPGCATASATCRRRSRSPRRSPRWTGRPRCCRPAGCSSARRCSSTCRRSPTRRWHRPAATCSASRCCSRRTAARAAGPGSPEPRRWLELFAERCEPGFLDSIVDWRAMTPDVYEREFHLPAGHAASFGGGPLAALRQPRSRADPLRDRRARAVPHRRGDVPRRRHLGRQRPQLRDGRPRPHGVTRGALPAAGGTGSLVGDDAPGSISLGRLAGAALRIHWSAVVVGGAARRHARRRPRSRSPAVVGVVAFFVSILGHELAHAVVARRYGVGTTSIDLWALGGIARLDREPRTPGPRAGSPPPARSPASPSASSGIGAAFGASGLGAPTAVVRVLAWLGIVNVAARRVQPAARRPARRRPHRARRALGAARQPLPGDARGRAGRPGHRLGPRRARPRR